MKKIVKWGGIGILVLLLVMQLYRPDRTNPELKASEDIAADSTMNRAVASVLRRACYDCHSNETRWPWYSAIAPASWLVARDVQGGRKHVNFSMWGRYPVGRRVQSLGDIHDEVADRGMPLPQYLLLHPEARLSDAERDSILAWTDRESARLGGE
jgi:hypothetical protein